MGYHERERRRQIRYDFLSKIEYKAHHSPESINTAIANNICKDGLGIYVFDPLQEGQYINITSTLPIDGDRAIVRWIKKENENFYKVGLAFTTEMDVPLALPG